MGRQKHLTAIIVAVGSLFISITPPECVAQTRCVSALMSSCVYATSSAAGWMVRPGTISDAMTKSDGSLVYLDAVVVDKIRARQSPGYMVVYEPFSPKDRLIVLTQPAPEMRLGQTVDVEGTITTLGNGYRAIINPTIYGYLDREGRLMLRGGTIKGFIAPTPWPWKTDLTVESASQSAEASVEPDPAPDDDPTYYPTISDIFEACAAAEGSTAQTQSIRVQSYYEEIPDVQALPDGSLVELQCKRILGVGTQTINSIEYRYVDIAEDLPATDWIRAYCAKDVSPDDRVNLITGQIQRVDTIPVICVDTGPLPQYKPELRIGRLLTASAGTIAWVKTWADNHSFAVGDLTGKIVTRKWIDYLYIEEDDRSSGIRVGKTAHGHSPSERVDVVGVLKTDPANSERYIDASDISQNGTGSVAPLGMINRSLGGGDFFYDPNTSPGQRGITGGTGVNNIGLLVGTWGRISELDPANPPQWFRITDGSNVQTTVAYPPFAYALNDFVTIAGISSCEIDGNGDLQRVLAPQPLICTICKAEGQADPTNTTPVNFTVTFSEPVIGFAEDDVTVSGVAGATTTVSGSGATYNAAVELPVSGTVTVSVPSGKARNASGVWNYASGTSSVLYDKDIPTIATCTVAPVLSSGQVTITYTGANDTGGSGLLGVGLYQLDSGQYTLVDARTGSSNTFALTCTGNGTVDNLVLMAFDNAGNQSADKVVPSFTIDQTAPTQPANVVMAHVLPTSRNIHATWDASTDANGIQNYSYQFWYVDGTGLHGLSGVLTTTNTYATFDVGGYLPIGTTTYGIRVWARDNAGNVSNYTDSSGVQCQKSQVGYLYNLAAQVWPNDTYPDGFRGMIHERLTNTANSYSSIMQYTQLTSVPTNLDTYDILVISCPALGVNLTTDEMTRISTWAKKWHDRLILVGDSSFYRPSGQSTGYYNQRLNDIASNVYSGIPAFKTSSGDIPSPYNIGTCYYFSSYHSWLLTSVTGLNYASPGWFDSSVSTWIARVDATYKWIAETDLPNGGVCLGIHDCNVFDTYNTTASHAYFVRNICTRFE